MRHIAQKFNIYNNNKKEGDALDPPCSLARGKAPLTPIVPLRQTFFDEENLVFGKKFYFMIFLGEGK